MKRTKNKSSSNSSYTAPAFRQLRGYAFDPITSLDLETAEINQIIYKVPWEDDLKPGPEGEYIKVMDRDPMSDAVYKPVDLNEPDILASNGLSPSETNPQFHQQMLYAVIMLTIRNFEKALGRKIIWSPVPHIDKKTKHFSFKYVPQLLVFPHAVREQNAYYSPERKALLFGYYNTTPVKDNLILPGGIVYSCLSHDIIAHETTHALIDSLYPLYMEITHPDTAGFHEGFSDLVALLQHFTYPEIVRNQIRLVKGKLDMENLLIKLAVEFGQSTGEHKSLRQAIGETTEEGNWQLKTPSQSDYDTELECHDRGALLVAAVFDAFHAIYKSRTADLLRIASGGTGIMPDGDLHPDLVNRLAREASKTASRVLNICVRALDYCPPVDLNYGDYLRALITADKEIVANDDHHYRIAFINAFRKRGIFPIGIPNLSVDTVCYTLDDHWAEIELFKDPKILRDFKDKIAYITDREKIYNDTAAFIGGEEDNAEQPNEKGRRPVRDGGLYRQMIEWLAKSEDVLLLENLTGLVFSDSYKQLEIRSSKYLKNRPATWIQSLRLSNRVGPDGNVVNQLILTMIQTVKTVVVESLNEEGYRFEPHRRVAAHEGLEKFLFRGGCTLIFNLDELRLIHAISKPLFNVIGRSTSLGRTLELNQERALMQYRCQQGELREKIGLSAVENGSEFFAALHRTQIFEL